MTYLSCGSVFKLSLPTVVEPLAVFLLLLLLRRRVLTHALGLGHVSRVNLSEGVNLKIFFFVVNGQQFAINVSHEFILGSLRYAFWRICFKYEFWAKKNNRKGTFLKLFGI